MRLIPLILLFILTATGLTASPALRAPFMGEVLEQPDTARSDAQRIRPTDGQHALSTAGDTLISATKISSTARTSVLPRRPRLVNDSTATPADTAQTAAAKKHPSGIDAPIAYEATDSIVYEAGSGLAHLFGEAKVNYMDMELNADRITMCLDSSLVHAHGTPDTTETSGVKGRPVYRQGAEEYHSENMSFNFRTQKGFIRNVNTVQGEGYMISDRSKRSGDGTLYLEGAKYTTCDAEHPHFYMKLTRAKVRPGKGTVFGPAYLVVEDVPLPLAIPYGFFPFTKKYSSGIIFPSYGDETRRGFYLRNGGYYLALSDYMDLKLLGEIYTKGSWGLSIETNYRKRYRYSGNFYFSFLHTVDGEKNMPDYMVTKSMKLQWSHVKDPKSNPNTTFSARVNFATEEYERKNLESMYDPLSYTQSTRASSVSFGHTFPNIGLSINASANLSQNMRNSSVSMTLPDLSINLNRFYPFRRKHQAGKERWYEKISLAYTGKLSNSITTTEDQLFKSNLVKDWRNGMQHNIPVTATFQLFKYINISPSFNFRDLMYAKRIDRSWDPETQRELCDTTFGFYNLYDWRMSVTANTTLYGFYKPWKKLFGDKIIAVRHVFKPSVSFSYAPDFTAPRFGYTKTYDKIDPNGNATTVKYSPYAGSLYGYPNGVKQGMISMSISNNLEMKVKSDRDTTGMRKISLIDEFSASMSYNLAAQTRPWSNLNTRIRLKLGKNKTFSMAAIFATYAYKFNEQGKVVTSDRTEWSYGRFGRFQGMSQNLSYTFNNKTWTKWMDKLHGRKSDEKTNSTDLDEFGDPEDANIDPDLVASRKGDRKKTKEKAKVDKDGYLTFSIPWSLTLSYGITMAEDRTKQINVRKMRYPYSFTQSLNASGFVRIADGWNVTFASGYDFERHKISMTTMSLARDLHCFEMSASVVLKPYSSFHFTFRARSTQLADALKWEKRSSYSSNIEWY